IGGAPGAGPVATGLVARLLAKAGLTSSAIKVSSPLSGTLAAKSGLTVADSHGVFPLSGTLAAKSGLTVADITLVRGDIVGTNLTNYSDSTDTQASYTSSPNQSPSANVGLVAWIIETGTACAGPTSVTGNGLTWVKVTGASSTAATVSIT